MKKFIILSLLSLSAFGHVFLQQQREMHSLQQTNSTQFNSTIITHLLGASVSAPVYTEEYEDALLQEEIIDDVEVEQLEDIVVIEEATSEVEDSDAVIVSDKPVAESTDDDCNNVNETTDDTYIETDPALINDDTAIANETEEQESENITIITECTGEYDLVGNSCLERCEEGYIVDAANASLCVETCASNWKDNGNTCQPPTTKRPEFLEQGDCLKVYTQCEVIDAITLWWAFKIYLGECPNGYDSKGALPSTECSLSCSNEDNITYLDETQSIRVCKKGTYERKSQTTTTI